MIVWSLDIFMRRIYLTSMYASQDIDEIEKADWNPLDYQKSLFEVTGYPLSGDIPLLNRKIFRGTRVNIREHPYIVSIRRLYSHFLTGTLITKNLILTVAHPIHETNREIYQFYKNNKTIVEVSQPKVIELDVYPTGLICRIPIHELRVVVGENYSDRGSSMLTIILVLIHQDFNPYTLVGDLAMIRFYEDVFFKSNIKSISLMAPSVNISNSTAYVTGWGRCDLMGKELCLPRGSRYYPDEKMDPMLRTVSMTITMPNYYCDGYKRHDTPVRRGMLCTGTAREDHHTFSCLAVPGAPLVVRGKLAGILSWGFGCGYQNDLPLVYTDIRSYIKWISQNIAIIRKISKNDFTPLFEATKSYILLEWLQKSRVNKPKHHVHRNREIQLINLDNSLTNLKGEIYDIRDYMFSKVFQGKKKLLYNDIRYAAKRNDTESMKLLYYTIKSKPFLSNKSLLEVNVNEDEYNSSDSEE